MRREDYHQLNQTIPDIKNPYEKEIRHPELPDLDTDKDARPKNVHNEKGSE